MTWFIKINYWFTILSFYLDSNLWALFGFQIRQQSVKILFTKYLVTLMKKKWSRWAQYIDLLGPHLSKEN